MNDFFADDQADETITLTTDDGPVTFYVVRNPSPGDDYVFPDFETFDVFTPEVSRKERLIRNKVRHDSIDEAIESLFLTPSR